MSRAEERILNPAARRPQSPAGEDADSKLNIAVIFTAVEPTLAALKHAGVLASNLGARISLVVPQVVPYPLPLNKCPDPARFQRAPFPRDRRQEPRGNSSCRLPVPRSDGDLESLFSNPIRWSWWVAARTLVAHVGEAPGGGLAPRRPRSDLFGNGVNRNARPVLHRSRLSVSDRLLGLHQGLRQALGGRLHGLHHRRHRIARPVCLSVYALLRPEKF